MNVVDVVIVVLLILGGLAGFKAGVIKKLTDFLGMFAVVILAFYLKNYISVIMYENLPFFNFFGLINGINALNILLYEVIAFLVIFILLLFVLKVFLLATGLIEKILKATVILSIPSKILGIIEMYVYIFLVLVIATLPVFDSSFLKDSKMANYILDNTLVLSNVSNEITDIYGDVYDIIDNRKDKSNEEMNEEILKVLIDKKVVTKESVKKLVERNKVHINDMSIVE